MVSGLILAGGASSRFGSPKAFADFLGRPMIAPVAAALQTRCEELLVSVGTAEQGRALQSLLPDAIVALDGSPSRGPIEGLLQGLRAARGEIVLVAPCDAPLLRPRLYDVLLEALGRHEAAVPRLAAFDPVRAAYRRGPALYVLEGNGAAVASPSALVDRLDATFVGRDALASADPDLDSFLDVNRPEDLEAAIKKARAV